MSETQPSDDAHFKIEECEYGTQAFDADKSGAIENLANRLADSETISRIHHIGYFRSRMRSALFHASSCCLSKQTLQSDGFLKFQSSIFPVAVAEERILFLRDDILERIEDHRIIAAVDSDTDNVIGMSSWDVAGQWGGDQVYEVSRVAMLEPETERQKEGRKGMGSALMNASFGQIRTICDDRDQDAQAMITSKSDIIHKWARSHQFREEDLEVLHALRYASGRTTLQKTLSARPLKQMRSQGWKLFMRKALD